jgi:hypothetical protein
MTPDTIFSLDTGTNDHYQDFEVALCLTVCGDISEQNGLGYAF